MRSAMSFYEQTLQQVVDATGDGKSYRDDPQPLTARLKAGEVYAVRCPDSTRYYRTVMLKRNDLTGKFQVFISFSPIYGDPPPQMQEVAQEVVFKQIREMNAGMVAGADFKAFPFTGRAGQ